MCECPRDKVIETYVGVRTLQERGVLMCSCVGVWGRERLLYVCVCVFPCNTYSYWSTCCICAFVNIFQHY